MEKDQGFRQKQFLLKGVLDKGGVALALFFGFILYFFGGVNYLILMLCFFILAIAATKYEHEIKKEMGLYEHERSWENVFSNGIIPTILAIASPFFGIKPFIGAIAAITADKFSSEIGVLDPRPPVSIIGLKSVKAGTSGAVSKVGTAASLMGSVTIALCTIFVFNISPNEAVIITVAGFFGSVVDTFFGYFEEQGIGTKSTTNIIGSIAGAILGGYLI